MLKVDEDKMNKDQQQTEDVASPSVTEVNTLPSSSYIRPKLRKDAVDDTLEAWLIGKLLLDLEPKVGSQLPTNGDVLRLFIYLNRGPMVNDRREDVIKKVIQKVEVFWKLAGIPTMPLRAGHSKARLTKIITGYENVRKSQTRKNFPSQSDIFLMSLTQLFDIAHENAAQIISSDTCRTARMISEDHEFLLDQRSSRKMELGSLDKSTSES